MTTGLALPFGIQTTNPVPVDSWMGPYTSVIEANATVLPAIRFVGREVIIVSGGKATKYIYRAGIGDTDLVKDTVLAYLTTDHATLKGWKDASSLEPGVSYRIDIETQHVIPYTNVVRKGSIESIVLFATSNNTFDHVVKSLQYPKDTIHYDIDDVNIIASVDDSMFQDLMTGLPNLYQGYVNGNISPIVSANYTYQDGTVLTTSQRTGHIYYRKDSIYRNETPNDYRNVNLRRYHFRENTNGDKFIINDTSIFSELLDTGSVMYLSTGYLYKHLSVTLGKYVYYISKANYNWNPPLTTIDWLVTNGALLDLSAYLNDLLNTNDYPYYSSPSKDLYVLMDYFLGSNKLLLEVDNTDFHDFTYFDNDFVKYNGTSDPDSDGIYQSFNCKIENFIPAYLEQVTLEYYPNVVFFNRTVNVTVGKFTTNTNIYKSCDLEIGAFNDNLYVQTYIANHSKTVIADNNKNMIVRCSNFNMDGLRPNSIALIGSGNNDVIIEKCSNFNLGNNNILTVFIKAPHFEAGDTNKCVLMGGELGISLGNKIASFVWFTSFAHSTYYNQVRRNFINAFISVGSAENILKSFSNNIQFLDSSNLLIEGLFLNGSSDNVIGEKCSNLKVNGSGNRFENVVSVTLTAPANNCTFKNMNNQTFSDATILINNVFDYSN